MINSFNNWKIIDAGNCRYLSEVEEFKECLPFGIINKMKPDVGGTYVAANCPSHYIIVCPFIDLVESIACDENNKYEVYKCYGKSTNFQFKSYLKRNSIYKIAVTYDSLPKLLRWIDSSGCDADFKVLIDEYHLLLSEYGYREKAIVNMMNSIKRFSHYTLLSATPIDQEYEIDAFKDIPHYKVIWNNMERIEVKSYKSSMVIPAVTRFIQLFLSEGVIVPKNDGGFQEVEQLFIFLNSVVSIKQILSTLNLKDEDVKICCASRQNNIQILGSYKISRVVEPNKKINIFTKKCWQGCNMFTSNGLIVVVSDAYRTNTLVDISTSIEQIAGRFRENAKYHNIFSNLIIHFYSTNKSIYSDDEFEEKLQEQIVESNELIKAFNGEDTSKKSIFYKHLNLEQVLVYLDEDDNQLHYNHLKEMHMRSLHEIRKMYSSIILLNRAYGNNSRVDLTEQYYWKDFNIKMAKIVTFSYEKLCRDYFENPDEDYLLEYPELDSIHRYLTVTECNTMRWNKEKMLKAVSDYQNIQKILNKIHHSRDKDGFISCKKIKSLLNIHFTTYGIDLAPKATLIEKAQRFTCVPKPKRVDGVLTKGYYLSKMIMAKETTTSDLLESLSKKAN